MFLKKLISQQNALHDTVKIYANRQAALGPLGVHCDRQRLLASCQKVQVWYKTMIDFITLQHCQQRDHRTRKGQHCISNQGDQTWCSTVIALALASQIDLRQYIKIGFLSKHCVLKAQVTSPTANLKATRLSLRLSSSRCVFRTSKMQTQKAFQNRVLQFMGFTSEHLLR